MRPMPKLLICSLLICLAITSDAQSFSWANGVLCNKTHLINTSLLGIATDNHHNIIAAGTFADSCTIGASVFKSKDYSDGYVVKYDSGGNALWTKQIAGSAGAYSAVSINSTATDINDNVFILGNFKSNVVYFTTTDSLVNSVSSTFYSTYFLAKYNSSGNFLWAKTAYQGTHGSPLTAYSVITDGSGNAIICGTFGDTLAISGGVTLTAANGFYFHAFIAKFDPTGNILWAKKGIAAHSCIFNSVATDALDNIYATGYSDSTTTIDTGTINSLSGSKILTVKFDKNGNYQWGRLNPSHMTLQNLTDAGNSIAVDRSGNSFVCGTILDTTILGHSSSLSGIVLKYNNNGILQWQQLISPGEYGNKSYTACNGVSLDVNGNPYVVGDYDTAFTIGTTLLPNPDSAAGVFVTKLDRNTGNPLWALSGAGTHHAYSKNITVDENGGGVAVIGYFYISTSFGGNSIITTTNAAYNSQYITHIANLVLDVPVIATNNNWLLYPNPAKNNINISFTNSVYHRVVLSNEMGKVLETTETTNDMLQMDINTLPNGIYFITVCDNQKNIETRKFIKLQ